ncbi:MAG: DMT family transporter [Pseudomonadota bacterium]|nr:DMT family transporter [Pseudomonadota bacterium]
MNKKVFSLICAISCSFIWGTAFVAQDMGMDHIGPFTFTAVRLFLGFLTLLPIMLIQGHHLKKINLNQNAKIFYYLVLVGFMLSFGNSFQQLALLYTDVANTAVFTAFYVILVPMIAYYYFSKNIHWSIWPSALFCLIGGFLLTNLDSLSVRIGDSIAVINAFMWAFHIVFISKLIKIYNYPVIVACLQCLIGSFFAFIPAVIFETIVFSNILLEYKELLYAGVLSSGVAFLLQVYSQQNLPPAPVTIIFSLEGVFASIFGWIILDQFLTEIKIFGIIIILSSVIFSQLIPIYGKKKYG